MHKILMQNHMFFVTGKKKKKAKMIKDAEKTDRTFKHKVELKT